MHVVHIVVIFLVCSRFVTSISTFSFFFFFNDTATTEIYTLSLHDALPILGLFVGRPGPGTPTPSLVTLGAVPRSEEHTSELQSHVNLVCRLLLEKKKKNKRHRSGPHLPIALTALRLRRPDACDDVRNQELS